MQEGGARSVAELLLTGIRLALSLISRVLWLVCCWQLA